MIKETLSKAITQPFHYSFEVDKPGLVAISVSARCKSAAQLQSSTDEDLRVEINGLQCREMDPAKYKQLFNTPSAFNGSKLKGLKKTVTFVTVLRKGKHIVSLIPRPSALIENIFVYPLGNDQSISLKIEDQAEDGNTRPWHTVVLIDLPLSKIEIEATVERRLRDSDDIKIILAGNVKENSRSRKHKYWYILGGVLNWKLWRQKGEISTRRETFTESLDNGVHYIEFYADRMPILHQVNLSLTYKESSASQRATSIVKKYSTLILLAAQEFKVDPVIVGAVIYQEQSTNVNFVDTLTDYLGGIFHFNTSIGIAQVRVKTASDLEEIYPALGQNHDKDVFPDYTIVRVERLKDPLTNIRYAAAKISFSQERWEKTGSSIKNKPEILGTLYNIEDIKNPIKPNDNPQPNNFGKGVNQNYSKVKQLLGL